MIAPIHDVSAGADRQVAAIFIEDVVEGFPGAENLDLVLEAGPVREPFEYRLVRVRAKFIAVDARDYSVACGITELSPLTNAAI